MTADLVLPAPDDRLTAAKLAVLGMISGAVSWVLVDFSDQLDLSFDIESTGLLFLPISIYPGLVFGLVFATLLHLWAKVLWLRAIGFVFAAGLAYLAAFHVAFHIIADGFSSADTSLPYIVGGIRGGLAGSLVLGLLTKFLLQVPARLVLRRPVVVGAIAGALLGLASFEDHNGWGFFAFFVLWQGIYAASLASLMRRSAGASAS